MRLTAKEREQILRAIRTFDESAQVFLFGSRTDDRKRGGDIDLLIVSNVIDFLAKSKIRIALHDALGEQKIDLVIVPSLLENDPFIKSITMVPL